MTIDEFISSLPAALTCTGAQRSSGAEIATRIRKELAAAVTAGVFPVGTTFSVRSGYSTHTMSIDVDFTAWPGEVFSRDYQAELGDAYTERRGSRWDGMAVDRYSSEILAASVAAKRIADRHNFDRSDSRTDYSHVGYYLHVETNPVEDAAKTALRTALDPAFADMRARAIAASATLPANLVKSIARDGIDRADENELSKILRWADRAKDGTIVHSKRHGWTVQRAGAAA
jgi:hypothetical protein